MTESGFSLPKAYVAEQVLNHYKGDYKHIKTIYDNNNYKSGESIRDQQGTAMRTFHDEMSPALKRMKATWLNNVVANCYPDHHISDDFTNQEQINLCRKDQYEAVFGTWDKHYKNHRASDLLRLNQCLTDGGREVMELINCHTKYVEDIKETNMTLKNIFVQENKEYL